MAPENVPDNLTDDFAPNPDRVSSKELEFTVLDQPVRREECSGLNLVEKGMFPGLVSMVFNQTHLATALNASNDSEHWFSVRTTLLFTGK